MTVATSGSCTGRGTPVSVSPDHFLLGKHSYWGNPNLHTCVLCHLLKLCDWICCRFRRSRPFCSELCSFGASPTSGHSFIFNNCWSERIQSGEERRLSWRLSFVSALLSYSIVSSFVVRNVSFGGFDLEEHQCLTLHPEFPLFCTFWLIPTVNVQIPEKHPEVLEARRRPHLTCDLAELLR